jgi:hypothetical protein
MRKFLLLLLLASSVCAFAQTQDNAITATIEQTGTGTFDVVFAFNRAVTGTGNPINVYLKVPDAAAFSAAPAVSSSYSLAFINQFSFEGNTYYTYQGQPSIDLSTFGVGDRLIAGSFTVPTGDTANDVNLSGGDFAPASNGGGGFIWPGTSLLTNNTETNLVAWPIAERTALPVTYLRFEAVKHGKVAFISWETSAEEDNYGYHVQNSTDGNRFTTVGFVDGLNREASYDFAHNNPAQGMNYYRLEQEGLDGSTNLSEIRTVIFAGDVSGITVFPNPVVELLTVSGITVDEQTRLRLWDASGRLVVERSGTNQLTVDTLPAGPYSLEIVTGQESTTKQVIIKR